MHQRGCPGQYIQRCLHSWVSLKGKEWVKKHVNRTYKTHVESWYLTAFWGYKLKGVLSTHKALGSSPAPKRELKIINHQLQLALLLETPGQEGKLGQNCQARESPIGPLRKDVNKPVSLVFINIYVRSWQACADTPHKN